MLGDFVLSAIRRPLGLKVIIGYKFVKAPIMLALALWLAIAPHNAFDVANAVARELLEGGALWVKVGKWIESQLSTTLVTRGAILSGLDSIVTVVEAVLLLKGKSWGEWIVVSGLAALLPFELRSLIRHPHWLKLLLTLANAGVVAYLVWRRLKAAKGELRDQRAVSY